MPSGNPIVVLFDLNLDGILKVTARERATGLQKQVTYENALTARETTGQTYGRDDIERLYLTGAENEPPTSFVEEEEDMDAVPELAPGPREGQRSSPSASVVGKSSAID